MGDHVLLENEDDAPQDFSNTNPFAPRPASPEEGDWKAKLGAFARKAGDTVKQHAAKAAASAQVKLAEAKVKLNELTEDNPPKQEEDIVISSPTNGRRVPVDWNGSTPSLSSDTQNRGPPALPPKNSLASGPKKTYGPKKMGASSPSHSRASSSSSVGSVGALSSSGVGTPNYEAMTRTSSSSGLAGTRSPRPLVFGASLKIATSDSSGTQIHDIPPVVRDCIEIIHRKGLREEGIFRIGGSHAALQEYRARYNSGAQVDLSGELDVNNVSGLLKMYLRELPEHLFTDHLMPLFQNAYTNADLAEGELVVSQLLPLLPSTNLLILQQLFALLVAITKMANVNMMNAHNLGIIFTQCLRIDGSFFQYLISRPHLLADAKPTSTQSSTQADLIQWS